MCRHTKFESRKVVNAKEKAGCRKFVTRARGRDNSRFAQITLPEREARETGTERRADNNMRIEGR